LYAICSLHYFKIYIFFPILSTDIDILEHQLANTHLQETPLSQGSASAFASTVVEGLGYLPTLVRFIPELDGVNLMDAFVPTTEEIKHAPLMRIYGEKAALNTWGETEQSGVAAQFDVFLQHHAFDGLKTNGMTQFGTRGLETGIAAPSTYNDCNFFTGTFTTGDLEHKGAEGSVLAAVKQAVVSVSNMQVAMLNHGVEREKCVMPVIGNTGLIMIFGVSVVLAPSFPSFIPLSKQLDLADPNERKVASAYLKKAVDWANSLGIVALSLKKSKELNHVIALSLDQYFVKIIDDEVFQRGFGLFSDDRDPKDIQPGLVHMVEALNRVFACNESRDYAEYPIAVRTPDKDNNHYELVYRNLTLLGFKTGAPNRKTHPETFEKYLHALCEAVKAIGTAGVVHGDLYSSNVMYAIDNEGQMKIKIVDWDAAHCLEEGNFVEKVGDKLLAYFGDRKLVNLSTEHDKMYVDALKQEIGEDHGNVWEELASGDKRKIDSAFKWILMNSINGRNKQGIQLN